MCKCYWNPEINFAGRVHVVFVLVRGGDGLASRCMNTQVGVVFEEYVFIAQVWLYKSSNEAVVRSAESIMLDKTGYHLRSREGLLVLPPLSGLGQMVNLFLGCSNVYFCVSSIRSQSSQTVLNGKLKAETSKLRNLQRQQ